MEKNERVEIDGAAIRSARRAAGLSPEEFAARAGVSMLYLGNVENGRYRTALRDTAERLLAAASVGQTTRRRRAHGRIVTVPA